MMRPCPMLGIGWALRPAPLEETSDLSRPSLVSLSLRCQSRGVIQTLTAHSMAGALLAVRFVCIIASGWRRTFHTLIQSLLSLACCSPHSHRCRWKCCNNDTRAKLVTPSKFFCCKVLKIYRSLHLALHLHIQTRTNCRETCFYRHKHFLSTSDKYRRYLKNTWYVLPGGWSHCLF